MSDFLVAEKRARKATGSADLAVARRVIRAEILQEWASRVNEGQEAVIEDDTRTGLRWHGKVKHLSDWYTHRRSMLKEPFQYNDGIGYVVVNGQVVLDHDKHTGLKPGRVIRHVSAF